MLYRFDDAYQKVYEYSPQQNAYIYVSSYAQSGINGDWTEEQKAQQMEKNFRDAINSHRRFLGML